jgi:hypothetical protein
MTKLIKSKIKFVSIFLEREYISILLERRVKEEKDSKKIK